MYAKLTVLFLLSLVAVWKTDGNAGPFEVTLTCVNGLVRPVSQGNNWLIV